MKILIIGAHPDDEIYGCGGTIAKLASEGNEVSVLIVTEGSTAQYADKKLIAKKREEAEEAKKILGVKNYYFGDFPDMKLDTVPHVEINRFISEHISKFMPDWVFTHSPYDLNRDHQAVFHSTLVAARPQVEHIKKILSYEVPSTSELGIRPFDPNVYVDISPYMVKKIAAIKAYKTELRSYPHGRSPEAVESLGRYRGYSSNCQFAEAFFLVREKL